MGFGVPIGDWFRGALRDLPGGDPARPTLARSRLLPGAGDPRRSSIATSQATEDTSNKIWALLQLELWLRTYVDAERPAPQTISA